MRFTPAVVLLCLAALLSACGGGGGGGAASSNSIAYVGRTTRAAITTANAGEIARAAYIGGGTGSAVGGRTMAVDEAPLPKPLYITLSDALGGVLTVEDVASTNSSAKRTAGNTSKGQLGCANGEGTLVSNLDYQPDGRSFSGTISFDSYCSEGINITGTVYVSGTINDFNFFQTLSMSFPSLALYSPSISYSMGGAFSYEHTSSGVIYSITLSQRDEATGLVYRLEGLEMTIAVGVSITAGRFYHPDYGHVDMATDERFGFDGNSEWPSSGILRLTGAASAARLSAYVTDTYRVEADCDGDGVYEHDDGLNGWADVAPNYLPPVANAGVDQVVNIFSGVTLDGSASYDSYGRELTYAWSLVTVPAGSAAVLEGADTATPTFVADKASRYVVGLVVTAGGQTSQQATVSVDSIIPANYYPTADAGPDLTAYLDGMVTLDGGASSANAYGELTYSWALVSRPYRSVAELSEADTSRATLTPDHVGTYKFKLTVDNGIGEAYDYVNLVVESLPLFSPYEEIPATAAPVAVAVGDLNGDGRNDVAAVSSSLSGSSTGDALHVFYQTSAGTLQSEVRYPIGDSGAASVDIGDVNGDGKQDILVGGYATCGTCAGFVGAFIQNAYGVFDPIVKLPSQSTNIVMTGDMNNDGRTDIASVLVEMDRVEIYLQDPGGALSPPVEYSVLTGGYPHFTGMDVGDLDNDGLNDLVVNNTSADYPLAVLYQNSTGVLSSPVYHSFTDPGTTGRTIGSAAIGDVNGDALSDLVAFNSRGKMSSMGVYLQNGLGGLEANVTYRSFDIPCPIEIVDINGDGFNDVVVGHAAWSNIDSNLVEAQMSMIGVFLQKPDGAFGSYNLYAVPYSPRFHSQGLSVGDINGDGKQDVVIAGSGLYVLYNIN